MLPLFSDSQFCAMTKSNSFFQFRQFRIEQDRCALKVGTDGVLLGGWTDTDGAKNILDIGTGTGLIALMLAQRTDKEKAKITAIEIDEETATQAKINISNSKWAERITVKCQSLQDHLTDTPFDLIVCNPPYFSNSMKSADDKRAKARHDDTLPAIDLATHSIRLLAPHGCLCIILPTEMGMKFAQMAQEMGLWLRKSTLVFAKPGSTSKRVLMELCTDAENTSATSSLLIRNADNNEYTPEYKKLLEEFFLSTEELAALKEKMRQKKRE